MGILIIVIVFAVVISPFFIPLFLFSNARERRAIKRGNRRARELRDSILARETV